MSNIYEQIFDMTNENMEKAGKSFTYTKNACIYPTKANAYSADIFEMTEDYQDNCDFLQVAYFALLQRPVDERAFNNWKLQFGLERVKFQKSVIKTLISSQEYINSGIKVINNIYQENKPFEREIAAVVANSFRVPERLVRIYRKLPQPIKKIVKKLAVASAKNPLRLPERLVKIYRKLPQRIKSILKKIMGMQ